MSQALIEKAGIDIINECISKPVFTNDIMMITHAPNLICNYVVHLLSPQSSESDKISLYLLEAFKTVETVLKCRSIAVPAIGTGKQRLLQFLCGHLDFISQYHARKDMYQSIQIIFVCIWSCCDLLRKKT